MKSHRDKKPRGGFTKKGQVWRSDRAQETAKGGRQQKASRPQKTGKPHRAQKPPDEESRLQARALAGTGPGGYAKFGDIPAYKAGRALRGDLYKIANQLPDEEKGNLASRIKHAATSVTASLAAGFGEGTFRAGINRALESRGALTTVQDLLDQVLEQNYADQEMVSKVKTAVEAAIASVNEYLGRLAKEREKNSC